MARKYRRKRRKYSKAPVGRYYRKARKTTRRKRRRSVGMFNGKNDLMNLGLKVVGGLGANFIGSGLAYLADMVPFLEKNPKIRNIAISAVGTVATWKAPQILKKVPMMGGVGRFLEGKYMKPMLEGATYLFGFTTALNLVSLSGAKIPGFGGKGLLNNLQISLGEVSNSVAGLWGTGDFKAKQEMLTDELADANSKLSNLPAPKNNKQRQAISLINNCLGYANTNLENAKKYIEEGNNDQAAMNLEKANELILTANGVMCGYTSTTDEASIMPAVEETAVSEPIVDTEEGTVVIPEPETGEEIEVETPDISEELITTEEGTTGRAFNVDHIENWARWAAERLGTTDAKMLIGFLLRYAADREHTWAYGRNPVTSSNPGTTSGYNDSLIKPLYLKSNGETYKVETLSGISEFVHEMGF